MKIYKDENGAWRIGQFTNPGQCGFTVIGTKVKIFAQSNDKLYYYGEITDIQFKNEAGNFVNCIGEADFRVKAKDVDFFVDATQLLEVRVAVVETNKVDKIDGKSLSANDFTNDYKTIVDTLYGGGAILYGVERLRNSPDPDFIPIGNMHHHKTLPIHNLRQIVKVNFARQITGILNQTDITKMQDGTSALLDGSDGTDIVVKNPKMWAVLDGGGSTGMFERWIIGDRAFTYDGDVAIEINEYVDAADNCTLDASNRLRCVRNETAAFAGSGALSTAGGLGYPRTSISRYNMEVNAGNRGAKNYGTYYRDHLVEAALMYIEFKTKNLKAVFGSCGTGWGSAEWSAYNAQNTVLKILEAHLSLSGRSDIVSQGHLTGTFLKTFNFMNGATPVTYNTPFGCYRGKVLRNGIWNHISGIEYEIQSIADGGLSKVWLQMNPDLLDANRLDSSFAFKDTYSYMGTVPRADGWSKGTNKKSKQASATGGGETTYDCQYFFTNIPASGTSRRCVLEGGDLYNGGVVAFGSSYSHTAPSHSTSHCGVGFRADVAQ